MVVVVMGVSGSGKTTVGRLLAARLGWPFYDADDYHPSANVEKMSAGVALTDEDRQPWLETLRALIEEVLAHDASAVVACSALKASYRALLQGLEEGVRFVYLKGSYEAIERRMARRANHFMRAGMLAGQFAALEEPEDAIVVDVSLAPAQIVDRILEELAL